MEGELRGCNGLLITTKPRIKVRIEIEMSDRADVAHGDELRQPFFDKKVFTSADSQLRNIIRILADHEIHPPTNMKYRVSRDVILLSPRSLSLNMTKR